VDDKLVEVFISRMRTGVWVGVAVAIASGLGLAVFFGRALPPQVPMWYSRPWGEVQLANPAWLALLPIMTVGIGAIVNLISNRVQGEKILSAMILAGGLVIQTVLLLGLFRIVIFSV
jgi:hypothetical protein